MSIVVWEVDKWRKEPRRKEYARETASFYVRADGRRDAKRTSYSKMYSDFEEACRAIKSRLEAEEEKIRAELVRKAAPELLEAAEHCRELLMRYEINRVNGEEIADEAIAKLNAAIAKARGES